MYENQIKNAILDACRQAGGQCAFAKQRGLSQSWISDYISGHKQIRNMSIQTLYKFFPNLILVFPGTEPPPATPLEELERRVAALDTLINEKVKSSLNAALKTMADAQEITESVHETVIGADTGIVTTQDEIDGCNIIKAIATELIAPERVVMRDARSYCAILFDDNNRKPLVRLFFNNPAKLAVVFFDGLQEEKVFIEKVSDIYSHKDRILATLKKYSDGEKNQ